MPFTHKLVLWLHLAFVAFTIGPVTLAIMSTPRYIRQRDVRILRYLNRITFVFALGTLGVLVAGEALASMTSVASKPWVIVAATLFIVALLLLALILRDQRKAIKALDEAAASVKAAPAEASTAQATSADQPADQIADDEAAGATVADPPAIEPATTAAAAPAAAPASAPSAGAALQVAHVERGRIAMMGGLVSLIWLVILVLMVWH